MFCHFLVCILSCALISTVARAHDEKLQLTTNYLMNNRQGNKNNEENESKNKTMPRSCLDYLKNGETEVKVFTIMTPEGPQQVLCDLRSEPGSAWTLVLSHRMEYSLVVKSFRSSSATSKWAQAAIPSVTFRKQDSLLKAKMIRLFLTLLMICEMTFPVSFANKEFDGAYEPEMKNSDMVSGQGERSNEGTFKRDEPARSCLDHLKKGKTEAKVFTITTPTGPQQVFCDLKSEPGSAWTLVMSYQLKYTNQDNIAPFQKPLNMSIPINERSPNYNMYRMTLAQMTNIKSHSTHWRVTCNTAWVDYVDYLRVRFDDLDPLSFIGKGECKKVEYINVRGHVGINVTAAFWQVANQEILHHDSSVSHCAFGRPSGGYVPSEDNFGFYKDINRRFRCAQGDSSTTNMWFGAYL